MKKATAALAAALAAAAAFADSSPVMGRAPRRTSPDLPSAA